MMSLHLIEIWGAGRGGHRHTVVAARGVRLEFADARLAVLRPLTRRPGLLRPLCHHHGGICDSHRAEPRTRAAPGLALCRWREGTRSVGLTELDTSRHGGSPTEAELNTCFFRPVKPLIWEPWNSGSLWHPLVWLTESRLSLGAQGPIGLGSGPTSASQQVPDLGQFQILVEL